MIKKIKTYGNAIRFVVFVGVVCVAGVFLLIWSKGRLAAEGANQMAEYRQITQKEAKEIMDSEEGYIILDVRTPEEYADGHIAGAINLPNGEIDGSEPDLLTDKDQLILIYCRSGNRSKQAAEKLAAMGYNNIMEFGGIIDWPYATEQ